MALAVCGVGYLRLRRHYRAAAHTGTEPPSAWKLGWIAVLISGALEVGVLYLGIWAFAP